MRLEAFFAAKMPYGYHERLRWERRFSYGSFSSTKVLWQSDDTGWRFSAFSGNLVCLRGLASATLLIMSLESTAAPNCSWKVSQKLSRNFNTRAKAQGSCCQEISHHLSIYSNLNNFSKLNIVSTLNLKSKCNFKNVFLNIFLKKSCGLKTYHFLEVIIDPITFKIA